MKKITRILFYTNSIVAVLAFLPALMCLLFTFDCWTYTPSGCTDCWDFGYSNGDRMFFTSCTFLLILFYRYAIFNPITLKTESNLKSLRFYFLSNAVVNGIIMSVIFYNAWEISIEVNEPEDLIGLGILLVPLIPFMLAAIGLFTKPDSSQIISGNLLNSESNDFENSSK